MKRVVLDTNVLVAAAYNPASASRRMVEACLSGRLELALSEAVRGEYDFILPRAVRKPDYNQQLADLIARAALYAVESVPRVVPEDPDDDKLIALALTASAAALVTSDAHLLALNGHRGLWIATAKEVTEKWGL